MTKPSPWDVLWISALASTFLGLAAFGIAWGNYGIALAWKFGLATFVLIFFMMIGTAYADDL